MENLGEIFLIGKNVNLETSELNELNKYLESVRNKKTSQKNKLNNFLEQICN